jgi:hypothetical protein
LHLSQGQFPADHVPDPITDDGDHVAVFGHVGLVRQAAVTRRHQGAALEVELGHGQDGQPVQRIDQPLHAAPVLQVDRRILVGVKTSPAAITSVRRNITSASSPLAEVSRFKVPAGDRHRPVGAGVIGIAGGVDHVADRHGRKPGELGQQARGDGLRRRIDYQHPVRTDRNRGVPGGAGDHVEAAAQRVGREGRSGHLLQRRRGRSGLVAKAGRQRIQWL